MERKAQAGTPGFDARQQITIKLLLSLTSFAPENTARDASRVGNFKIVMSAAFADHGEEPNDESPVRGE